MLERQQFVVKEHVAWLKVVDHFDILDPETQEKIGDVAEEIGFISQLLRFLVSKKLTPSIFRVREHPEGALVFELRRGIGLFKFHVDVFNSEGEKIGYFVSKVFTLSGGFKVYTADDKLFAEVKGTTFGWHFTFTTTDGQQIGEVSKKFTGMLKEMFTTADTYLVSISEELSEQPISKMLLLATALAIDTVYKDNG